MDLLIFAIKRIVIRIFKFFNAILLMVKGNDGTISMILQWSMFATE